MTKFGLISWDEAPEEGPDYRAPTVKLPWVTDGALYERHACTVLMTTTEEWEWGSLALELDCDGPPANHWLSYELDAMGEIGEILGIATGDETDRFLLENGIAPFQRFYMRITARYSRDYWGEYDTDIEGWVLSVEPWEINRICTEWEAYWARKRILMPCWP